MESGELVKLHYSTHSWFEFCTSESTAIKFNTTTAGKRQLVYRDRNPFVFWHYPPYDYYDGDTYYYKYKNNWFIDTFSKYNRIQQKDFVGIRENFFKGNNILSDYVYKDGSSYRLEAVIQSKDKNTYYSFVGQADENHIISSIKIKEYEFNYESNEYENISTYLFRYSGVNKGNEIKRPKDLKPNEIANDLNLDKDEF